MSVYLHYIPRLIQHIFSNRTWSVPTQERILYLTFDDGPHAELTPQILDLLLKFHAKVTFFHLGSKAEQYPILVNRCKSEGHSIGNHGYHHFNAWKTEYNDVINSIDRGKKVNKSSLYRPSYGRLPFIKKKKLFEENEIVMWDIMPGDFDNSMSISKCCKTIERKVTKGNIIVLHENDKSAEKVIPILEWVLKTYSSKGYQFIPLKLTKL